MRRIVRIFIGFLIACIAAALTTLLFVVTPAELIGWLSLDDGGERFARFALLWLAATTQSVIFSALFALVALIIAEWLGQRDWTVVLTRPKRSFNLVIPVDWAVARRLDYGDSLLICYREE